MLPRRLHRDHRSLTNFSEAAARCHAGSLLFSASSDKTAVVWHVDTYEMLHVFTGHSGGIYSLVLHGGIACSGSLDKEVRIWPKVRLSDPK